MSVKWLNSAGSSLVTSDYSRVSNKSEGEQVFYVGKFAFLEVSFLIVWRKSSNGGKNITNIINSVTLIFGTPE